MRRLGPVMEFLLHILELPPDDPHYSLAGRCMECATYAGE